MKMTAPQAQAYQNGEGLPQGVKVRLTYIGREDCFVDS